jgi:hypothetical protein
LSLPFLLKAYQNKSSGKDDMGGALLEAIGHIPHGLSSSLILKALGKGLGGHAKAAALETIGEMPEAAFDRALPILQNEISNARSMQYHRASAFFALLCLRERFGVKKLPQETIEKLNAFFDFAMESPPQRPHKAEYLAWHRGFRTREELRKYIDVSDELAFVSVPPPSEWSLPKHLYEFFIEPTDSGIDITLYNGASSLDRDHPWPATDAKADSYLREIGLIGENSALLVLRGNGIGVGVPPLFSKLGTLGHSHPKNSHTGASDHDMETYSDHHESLSAIRRNTMTGS